MCQHEYFPCICVSTEMFSLQVCAVVDGCYQKEVSLEYRLNLTGSDAQTDSRLMLGHALPLDSIDPDTGSCQLGNLMLFKGLSHARLSGALALIMN